MITQSEADALIAMQKKTAKAEIYNFPLPGEMLIIPIVSWDKIESFLVDVNRRTIRLTKCTYQERYQGMIILVRLDIDGSPHLNPEVVDISLPYLKPYNGQTIPCPHLHLYVEGFMDRWAIPSPSKKFPRIENICATLNDFFHYCNIADPPLVQRSIF